MSSSRTARRLALLLLTTSLAACGGGASGTQPPPTPPGFTIALSGTTLSVAQEGTNTLTVTIGRTGSFSGAVNLSVTGAPAGVNATFAPASVPSATTSATLTVTAKPAIALTLAPAAQRLGRVERRPTARPWRARTSSGQEPSR